ncbi:MAG: PAS domain-containing sensor histidine kinase [Planctomycetota bacterium]|jgi:K+-sensing histidine kinase KdpD
MSKDLVSSDKQTFFAPAGRASGEQVQSINELIAVSPNVKNMIDAMPLAVLILNAQRQIVSVNRTTCDFFGLQVQEFLGKRPGELIDCIHAHEGPDDCGTGIHCRFCAAVNTILSTMDLHQTVSKEAKLLTKSGDALDWKVTASPLVLDDEQLVCVAIEDLSSHKRRQVLENTFFHDVVNTIGAIIGFSRMLDEDSGGSDDHKTLVRLSEELLEEVECHRHLKLAEEGQLDLNIGRIDLDTFLSQLIQTYQTHPVAEGRSIVLQERCRIFLNTDPRLLKRILSNMIKNALEASAQGDTVTISCVRGDESTSINVHNPTVMSEEVQMQIFKRSFTTKDGIGHGIGTYSMKLLGEKYLKGTISFESIPEVGTTFTITLPQSQ